MLKKIRNRSPSKAESELMEFAKKLRYNNNGKIHIYEKKPSFSFKENQKTTINDLNKENFPKEKINLIKKKEFSQENQDPLQNTKRRKSSVEFLMLIDENLRKHNFPIFKEDEYSLFKHKSFKPIIELEVDNDFKSDNELIKNAQEGIYKNLTEVFTNMSMDKTYLKANLSQKAKY